MRVPIESVLDCDLVWDGVEWTQHEGLVYTGRKTTRYYQGLWATDNHDVWSESGEKIKFGKARLEQIRLQNSCGAGLTPIKGTQGKSKCKGKKERKRYVRCYDIVNAGSRHSYTCSALLVSNSSTYGASPTSIERKIEADIGFKPEEGTGEAILNAIEARQPRATAFLKEMETIPEQVGYYRAASGRLRHFTVLSDSIMGLSARTRSGQINALGRECRNFP